jgi:glycine reductase complex component B subunit alpha and beta
MEGSLSSVDFKLRIEEYPVTDIVLGERTALNGTRLSVNVEELEAIVRQEDALASIDVAVAKPGESVRIIHALDAVEAMTKVDGPGSVYPGFLGSAVTVGRGVTRKLTGMLILSTTEFPEPTSGGLGYREGIIDMTGPGQAYCQASNAINLVVSYHPRAGVNNQQLDDAIRRSMLRMAQFIGETSVSLPPASSRDYELRPVSSELPRIVYIDQIMSQTLMTRTFVYGQQLSPDAVPTVIHPNELMDGALVSGNYKNLQKVATYLHCNKPLMRELYSRHGVDLNFVGIVINRGHRDTFALKEYGAQYSAKLAKLLGAEGAVIAFEGGGGATVDFMLTVKACEQMGIRPVAEMFEHAAAGSGEFPIVYHVPEADAIVSRGAAAEMINAPKVKRVLGGSRRLTLYGGATIVDAAESFEVATDEYWGVNWQLGESGFVARDY